MKVIFLLLLLPLLGSLSPEGHAWNDVSRFADAIRAQGVQVQAGSTTITALDGHGVALLTAVPIDDLDSLRHFVQEGGRLLLTVESDAADPLLRIFDARSTPAPQGGPQLDAHPALQIIAPPQSTRFRIASPLVSNHATGLIAPSRLAPLMRFADGTSFAYHLRLGAGEVLIIGDASLFINLMRDVGGNAEFTRAVARWLTREGHNDVHILGPDDQLTGHLDGPNAEDTRASINTALAQLAGQAPDALVVHFFLAILLLATLAYLLLIFPGPPSLPPPPIGHGLTHHVERNAGAPGGPADPNQPQTEELKTT